MRVAIMQPYFLPYLLYFQLIHAVDLFIILDDVSFIRGGWINRNHICVSGKKYWLTLPLLGASQNLKINEIALCLDSKWKKKTLNTLLHSYKESLFRIRTMDLFNRITNFESYNLRDFVTNSLREISDFLGITTKFKFSSLIGYEDLKGQDRILKICEKSGATEYFNLPGGVTLYQQEEFLSHNIKLRFIQPSQLINLNTSLGDPYNISILDVIFNNDADIISSQLSCTSYL